MRSTRCIYDSTQTFTPTYSPPQSAITEQSAGTKLSHEGATVACPSRFKHAASATPSEAVGALYAFSGLKLLTALPALQISIPRISSISFSNASR